MYGAIRFIMPLISFAMFATPTLLVSVGLPRRNRFEMRLCGCMALFLIFFFIYNPTTDLSNQKVLPVGDFVSMAVFFAITLVLMMALVYACHDTTLLSACYCAVVAYTVQNLGASLSELANLISPPPSGNGILPYMFRMLFSCAVTFALYHHLVIRRIPKSAAPASPSYNTLILFFTVILVNIVFDMGVKRLPVLGLHASYTYLFRITQIAMCIVLLRLEYELLYSRKIQIEAATTERILRDRETQYELSRDTIEAINIKMHDIRHQIRHLERSADGTVSLDGDLLRDIAREVNVYDSTVKTGNEALDTILTEKTLLGIREHISLACIADGEALGFMSPTDLYALFGNAIENAFEAVRELEDEEQRNISLLARRVANMVSIHIENYFDGELSFDHDGNPITSKPDAENHGYGVKSMRKICERYGGTLTMEADGSTFAVNMLIPIP